MLEKFSEYFNDPRFHRERLFWAISLPVIFVVLPLIFVVMFFAEIRQALESKTPVSPTALVIAAPGALKLADQEIRMGNLRGAEEILQEAIRNAGASAAIHRKLGILLKSQGRFPEARDAFSAAILLRPETMDFYSRGQCAFLMGNVEEAGQDFAKAAELSPSNPIFSNKHYLFLISHGEAEAVRRRMNLDIQLGVTNTMDGWVVAAAAMALQEGKVKPAANLLSEASARMPGADLSSLLQDPAFDPYRQIPALSPFLQKAAAAASKTTPPPR